MGAKTPEDERQDSPATDAIAGLNPPKSPIASGLLIGVLEGADDDDDDDDDEAEDKMGADVKSDSQPSNNKKNKKKRKRTKKKKAAGPAQSIPPRVPLSDLFAGKPYPVGQLIDYDRDMNLERTTAEEVRHLATVAEMDDDFLSDYRKAAEVHRRVRAHAQKIAKPGVSMTELALEIEEGVRALTGHQGVETGDALIAGMAFPTGLCLNNVAAHWTPNAGQREVILDKDDVLSVDFGVHVNGRIVDSAFTVAFNPVYDPLLASVKAATSTGLKEAGIDARMDHISAEIQEVMESYEITLNGKTIPIRPTRNISGHNILRYRIHGDKQVPFAKSTSTQRMEEGDVFAIETFGTTGRGWLRDDVGVYGYGLNEGVSAAGLHHPGARGLLKKIEENFGPLVFAKRYLERTGVRNYLPAMRALVQGGIVEKYGPLVDVPGSYVAQFEHTVLLRPNCKEIISRGDDY